MPSVVEAIRKSEQIRKKYDDDRILGRITLAQDRLLERFSGPSIRIPIEVRRNLLNKLGYRYLKSKKSEIYDAILRNPYSLIELRKEVLHEAKAAYFRNAEAMRIVTNADNTSEYDRGMERVFDRTIMDYCKVLARRINKRVIFERKVKDKDIKEFVEPIYNIFKETLSSNEDEFPSIYEIYRICKGLFSNPFYIHASQAVRNGKINPDSIKVLINTYREVERLEKPVLFEELEHIVNTRERITGLMSEGKIHAMPQNDWKVTMIHELVHYLFAHTNLDRLASEELVEQIAVMLVASKDKEARDIIEKSIEDENAKKRSPDELFFAATRAMLELRNLGNKRVEVRISEILKEKFRKYRIDSDE